MSCWVHGPLHYLNLVAASALQPISSVPAAPADEQVADTPTKLHTAYIYMLQTSRQTS